ncbi:MAG: CotH kinase family protein [Clostridia bacterium]|nr:CotH kinase family protein [Clostridia bacterium]
MEKKKIKIITIIYFAILALAITVGIFVGFTFTHKITYNLYGGTNGDNATIVWSGKTITLKSPTKYGYVFTGWENKYGEKVEVLENIKSDISVHATWELDPEVYGDLPVIEITTKYGTLPDNKEDYVSATLNMFNCTNEEHNLEDKDIGIRLRGNSTRKFDKKPYRIKFNKKTKVLGMKSNKSWVLLADYIDQSSIRNYTAFNLASEMDNLSYGNSAHHIILTINGEYKGLYLLTEQVDEKEGRTGASLDINGDEIDISVNDTAFPFLIEMDRNALSEGIKGVDNFDTCFYPCEIKYPEYDERNIPNGQQDVVYNYIKEYVNAAFTSLKTGNPVNVSFSNTPMTFAELVDVDSFMEFWLVNQLMHNTDSSWVVCT